jgi:hypothetical protein
MYSEDESAMPQLVVDVTLTEALKVNKRVEIPVG